MSKVWDTIVIAIQLMAAETAFALYIASFFGYRWENGIGYLLTSGACVAVTSIPATVRDYRFFKRYWGLSAWEQKNSFPMQFFPARHVEWLNPLAWSFMGILFLHFLWFLVHNQSADMTQRDTGDHLRLVSLMVAFGGTLSTLRSKYPPTEMPHSTKLTGTN
jgi:hypothetical protein